MKDIIYRLKELSEYRLKHLPGQHDQRDHAWNRGMGAGGGSGVTMGAYRQSRQSILDQVRNGDISRKDARAQLLQMRSQASVAPAASVSTPTPTLALRAMPRTIDEAIAELSDEASYTPEQLQYVQNGIQNVKDILADPLHRHHNNLLKALDILELSSVNDDTAATIVQGLFSTSDISRILFDGNEEITIFSSTKTAQGETKTSFTRQVRVYDWNAEIYNNSATNNGRLSGIRDLGNAMMRRQAMASMMLHKIRGKTVNVHTFALTYPPKYSGFNKWPKVGYVFDLTRYTPVLQQFGFQSTNNVDLMQEQNAAGQYGYEVWDDIVIAIDAQGWSTSGDGRMEYTDLTNPGLQLMIQYGRTGMSRTKDLPGQMVEIQEEQPNRQFVYEECDADMDVVNLMWRDIIQEKNI